jgi:hypothetical protein
MNDKKIEQHPFEFILRINGNIICQRYFNIHNYNPEVIESLELKELLDSIAGININIFGQFGIIPKFLKDRSSEYIQFFEDNPHLSYKDGEDGEKDIWAKEDNYTFEIKIDDKIVGITQFSGNVFPPKIRYKVNLKHKTNIWGDKVLDENGLPIHLDIIPEIVKEIKKTFSLKTYTKEYMGYSLDCISKLEDEYNKKYQTLSN